jgi:hypothetical protein
MSPHRLLGMACCLLLGCSSNEASSETVAPGPGDSGLDTALDNTVPDAATDLPQQDAAHEMRLSFPQAVGGAVWVNPKVYAQVPFRIQVAGEAASAVVVKVGTTEIDAADPESDGTWIATIPTSGLADGITQVTATATSASAPDASGTLELGVGSQGVQVTDFSKVGSAGTPRLHRFGARAFLTWTDRSTGAPQAWMHELDGAGRFVGGPVALVEDAAAPPLYARVALGGEGELAATHHLGVLYQSLGSPYKTHFKITDMTGFATVEFPTMDPDGWDASFGGDIVWDGGGYQIAWRVFEAPLPGTSTAHSRVRWARVTPDGKMAGPVDVAESGDDKPIGGFDPFSFVKLDAIGNVSLLGYVRALYQPIPDTLMPKSQVARVAVDGTVGDAVYLGTGDTNPYTWCRESRVRTVGDKFVALWTYKDIMEPVDNPRNVIAATFADAQGLVSEASPVKMVDELGDRDEPFLMPHPEHLGILGWLDARSYEIDLSTGRIELYVAPVGSDLVSQTPVIFPHARFVAGTSELSLTPAGTNALVTWIDERHGLGIADPKPELYFETAWY